MSNDSTGVSCKDGNGEWKGRRKEGWTEEGKRQSGKELEEKEMEWVEEEERGEV